MGASPAAGDTGDGSNPLAFDLADRLNKALRVSRCKPGEMRTILGVSESTMTNYLNGTTRPKDGMLRQWAFRCGDPVTFEWLARGAFPDEPKGGGDVLVSPNAWKAEAPRIHRQLTLITAA